MSTDVLVQADKLVKHYGDFKALDEVSFKLAAGTTTGLLGQNGAGKSTLMKTLLGFLPHTSGACSVLGFSPVTAPLEVRRRVGYMPEHEAWFPGTTGLESVVLAGRLVGMPRDAAFSRAYEVLDYLGMDEARHRQVSDFSVGMKQKIKLAQAVVHGPSLLFLDEPISGLDPKARDEMLGLLLGIARSGVSMVVSSHVLPDIETLCENILMVSQGRMVYSGGIEQLRRQQTGSYTLRVLGELDDFRQALELAGCTMNREGNRIEVHVTGEQGPQVIWAAAAATGVQIREFGESVDTLETAFLRMLGRED